MADLIELEMVDFNVILGMDWIHVFYASIDCRTRLSSFRFLMSQLLSRVAVQQCLRVVSFHI